MFVLQIAGKLERALADHKRDLDVQQKESGVLKQQVGSRSDVWRLNMAAHNLILIK